MTFPAFLPFLLSFVFLPFASASLWFTIPVSFPVLDELGLVGYREFAACEPAHHGLSPGSHDDESGVEELSADAS